MEQVLLKDGPLNGTRVHVEPGEVRVWIAERAGPQTARSRSMPPELIVASKVGEYRRAKTTPNPDCTQCGGSGDEHRDCPDGPVPFPCDCVQQESSDFIFAGWAL